MPWRLSGGTAERRVGVSAAAATVCPHQPCRVLPATSFMEYETKNLKFAYAGRFPDNLKVIKTVNNFPVEVTAVGQLNPRTNAWCYSVGARDSLIGGRIIYNKANNSVEYRKSLPLPVFGGLTRPVLAASWELGSNWRKLPRLQLGLAVADDVQSTVDDGATLSNDGTVAFRKKMFLTRRWGVEVDGGMRFRLAHDVAGGFGGNSVYFDLAANELNLVLRL